MNLKELEQKRKQLYKEIKAIRKQEQELQVGEYKSNIGKFFKFNDESFYANHYIKITNIWASSDEIFVEGVCFFGEFIEDYADCHDSWYSAFQQFRFNDVAKWEDFKLKEITKEEFYYAFNDMLDNSLKSFNKFYDD